MASDLSVGRNAGMKTQTNTHEKLGANPEGSRLSETTGSDAPKRQKAGRNWELLRETTAPSSQVH